MEPLTYRTLAEQKYSGYLLREAPERVLQFGEGNFLRAFVEHFLDELNEKAGFHGKVVVVQPASPKPNTRFRDQERLYTLLLRGRENGQAVSRKRVISCVSRCLNAATDWAGVLACAGNPDLRFIVSNTTEAGIVFDPSCKRDDAPPASYPAKLTAFLYERWKQGGRGFLLLPCELIDHNGDALQRCCQEYASLWGLEPAFLAWMETENRFCSTLVDRIVTGYPRTEAEALWEELGYRDTLLDTAEVFGLWAIEGDSSILTELPFDRAGLPVLVTDDITPYKQRKVRILNGGHTSMVLAAYLAGQDIVRGCMEDPVIRGFLKKAVYEEIIPTLDLPRRELEDFAASVLDRFDNPYIDHRLLDISLNSASKWKARVLPSVEDYTARTGTLPRLLTFSFAAYLAFCRTARERGERCLVGRRGAETYEIRDEARALDFFYQHRDDDAGTLARAAVQESGLWEGRLEVLPGFAEAAARDLERIEAVGMYEALRECL